MWSHTVAALLQTRYALSCYSVGCSWARPPAMSIRRMQPCQCQVYLACLASSCSSQVVQLQGALRNIQLNSIRLFNLIVRRMSHSRLPRDRTAAATCWDMTPLGYGIMHTRRVGCQYHPGTHQWCCCQGYSPWQTHSSMCCSVPAQRPPWNLCRGT